MQKYHDVVQDGLGNGINSASIYVYDDTGALAVLKKDDESTALSNPITSADTDNYDSKGNFGFKAVNGIYDIKIVAADTTWKTDRVMFDHTEYNEGNGIYNGKFNVDQYELLPVTGGVTDTHYIDRWKFAKASVSADLSLETTSQPTGLNTSSLKCIATSTATGNLGFRQEIENYSYYKGKTVTVSKWVKSNSSDARLLVYDGTYLGSAAHSGGGDWELLTVTVEVRSAATSLSIMGRILSAAGSSVSVTSGDYIEFTDVRLDLGELRLSGDREQGQEKALCQLYYWKGSAPRGALGFFYASAGNASMHAAQITFPVTMRATPTITIETAPTYTNCTDSSAGGNANGLVHRVDVTATGVFRASGGVYSASAEL